MKKDITTDKDEIERIKKNVNNWMHYFKDNIEYLTRMKRYVLDSTITKQMSDNFKLLNLPEIEFNVILPYLMRLVGEFALQSPSIDAYVDPGTGSEINDVTLDFIRHHLKIILNDLDQPNIFKEQLLGYSVFKIWTEYENDKTFDLKFCVGKSDDITLIGFDPMAKKQDKSDGDFCFEIIPISKKKYENIFGDESFSNNNLNNFAGICATQNKGSDEITVLCRYYEKKTKKYNLLRIADGSFMKQKDYNKYVKYLKDNKSILEPLDVIERRVVYKTNVFEYILTNNKILSCKKTVFSHLPFVFIDGNSEYFPEGYSDSGSLTKQKVKSYLHSCIGSQNLKNVVGVTITKHIEKIPKKTFIMSLDSVPPKQIDEYSKSQYDGNLFYNQFDDSGRPLNPPSFVVPPPLDVELITIFNNCDKTIQNNLGAYDASLGINNNQLSGKAILSGSINSNPVAKPFFIKYMDSLQQVANVILDAMPKVYRRKKMVRVVDDRNETKNIIINDKSNPESPIMDFDSNDIKLSVKAGFNFELQRKQDLDTLVSAASRIPSINALLNDADVAGNIAESLAVDTIKSSLKLAVDKLKQQQNNPQQPPNPLQQKNIIEAQKMQLKQNADQQDFALKRMKLESDMQTSQDKLKIEHMKAVMQHEKNMTEKQVHLIDKHIQDKKITNEIIKNIKENSNENTEEENNIDNSYIDSSYFNQ